MPLDDADITMVDNRLVISVIMEFVNGNELIKDLKTIKEGIFECFVGIIYNSFYIYIISIIL